MALTKEEQDTLAALQKKAEEPDAPQSTHSRVENVNMTIDLSDETQVKRAVKAGLLPASYLEDDPPDPSDTDPSDTDPPRRRERYS